MPGLSRRCIPCRRWLLKVTAVLVSLAPHGAAHTAPQMATMRAVASDGSQSQEIVGLLQSALFTLNPDAVILWCQIGRAHV